MSDKINAPGQMNPERAAQEWRRLSPKLTPTLRNWIEQTVRTILSSHVAVEQQRAQLERDLKQKAQTQAQQILSDPKLTTEDKVAVVLTLIAGKMEADIQSQMSVLENTQAPSIDVETMKLKRMIDKRSQMFDMMSQIIDKYNQTAKNIIQNIGR
jgi:hypothetical protein